MKNYISLLKSMKLKVTPQRLAIIDYLTKTDSHPGIDKIFYNVKDKFPTISIATIYNTIQKLKEFHQILILNFNEGFMRYDGNTKEHQHFYCKKCHKVYDIFNKNKEINLSEELKGFKIENTNLSYTGICKNCN